jgi:hypothetical protein
MEHADDECRGDPDLSDTLLDAFQIRRRLLETSGFVGSPWVIRTI